MPDLSPRAYDDNPNSPFYIPPAEREQALQEAAREPAKEPGKKTVEHVPRAKDIPATTPQVMSTAYSQQGSSDTNKGACEVVLRVLGELAASEDCCSQDHVCHGGHTILQTADSLMWDLETETRKELLLFTQNIAELPGTASHLSQATCWLLSAYCGGLAEHTFCSACPQS